MRRHWSNSAGILTASGSALTWRRLLRPFSMALVTILLVFPCEIYLAYCNFRVFRHAYSWRKVHDPATWPSILAFPTHGNVASDSWIQIAVGYMIVIFFGTGRDALEIYRKTLRRLGLGSIIPRLRVPTRQRSQTWTTGQLSALSSRVCSLFGKVRKPRFFSR